MTAEINNTITKETPGGVQVVIRTKINAGQRNLVRMAMMKNVEVEPQVAMNSNHPADKKDVSMVRNINLQLQEDMEHAMLKVGVVKYGDLEAPDQILAKLLDSDPEEYDFVVKEVNVALDGVKFF